MFVGAVIMIAGTALQTASQSVRMFTAARFFVGFGLAIAGEVFAAVFLFLFLNSWILTIGLRKSCPHASFRTSISRIPRTTDIPVQLPFLLWLTYVSRFATPFVLMHIDGSSVLLGLHMVHSRLTTHGHGVSRPCSREFLPRYSSHLSSSHPSLRVGWSAREKRLKHFGY